MQNKKLQYETTIIINASLEDSQIETIITQTTETIVRNGGEIVSVNKWGRKRLAYLIRKKNNGYFLNIEFIAPGTLISQLERFYALDENILRYLTILLDEKSIKAKALAPPPSIQETMPEQEDIEKIPLFADEDELVPPNEK